MACEVNIVLQFWCSVASKDIGYRKKEKTASGRALFLEVKGLRNIVTVLNSSGRDNTVNNHFPELRRER